MAFPSTLPLDPLIQETSSLEEKQPVVRRVCRYILTQCTAAFQEAISDLRSIRRARAGLWSLFGAWALGMLAVLIYLAVIGSDKSSWDEMTACTADSSFNVNISSYNAWEASSFFEINLGAGNLTFTQAKVIDISWDITIGRGGQAVLAFISWRVFANYVATSMEFAPVTYGVFSIIYLQDEPSLFSTLRIARAFISERGLKSKLSMVFMILSMVFLIAWPTLAGAMTGYTTTVKAFVQDYDGNYIPYSDFKPIAYTIHDGGRVNLTEDYMVSFFSPKAVGDEPVVPDNPNLWTSSWRSCELGDRYESDECLIQRTTSDYVSLHGFFGLQNTSSVWINQTLSSPVLNISAYYLPPPSEFWGYNWADPRATGQKHPFRDPSNIMLAASNQTYLLTYVQSHGRCQPVQDRFKWGFSLIQLFIVVALLNIWTIGMYVMWLKAHFQLPLQGQAEVPGGWKSVLILAKRMGKELDDAGIDVQSLTDRQLKEEVRKQLRGGSVSFDTPLEEKGYSFRRGMKRWFKEKRPWCLTMLLALMLLWGVCAFAFYVDPFDGTTIIIPCLFLGCVFAIGVGSTIRSSILMLLFWIVVGAIVILCLYVSDGP